MTTTASPQRIYRWTVLIWGLLFALYFTWHFWGYWTWEPSDEVYANSALFHLVAFLIVFVPVWAFPLVLVLLAEFIIFGRKRPER